jgi:hypothetical protein
MKMAEKASKSLAEGDEEEEEEEEEEEVMLARMARVNGKSESTPKEHILLQQGVFFINIHIYIYLFVKWYI